MPNVLLMSQWCGLRVVPIVLCATSAFAQQRPLPATGEPPEVRQLRKMAGAPRPGTAPTTEQILRRFGTAPSVAPLPASSGEPPDIVERRRLTSERDTSSPRRASPKELLEIIRQQPGGPAKIERAKRAGAQLPQDGDNDVQESSGARGPSSPDSGAGAFEPLRASIATMTVTVTRTAWKQTVAGLGTLEAEAFFPLFELDGPNWGPLNPIPHPDVPTSPVGAAYDVKPYMNITLTAAADGWYIISVYATQTPAETRRYVGPAYQLVQSFPMPATAGAQQYPVLLQLAAGSHSFSWRSLGPSVWVYAVTVVKL